MNHSVLSPAGDQAIQIVMLWWLMVWVSTVVAIAVLSGVCVAVARGRRSEASEHAPRPSEHVLARTVAASVATTVLILIALLTASVWTTRTMNALHASSALTVELTGHQWWWEIQYDDALANRRVATANEMHIPVGRPVVLKLTSRDVIHSFWVPSLQGKRDLIPGYNSAIWLQADRPGLYHGQCAEFCGLQHAHMGIDVIAESEEAFDRWLAQMRQPAEAPAAEIRKGLDVFMTSRCAGCHTIRGTDAAGTVAPDLTHIAARSTLGAGTLSNTADNLAAWIRDPQHTKPGNQMPPTPLPREDEQAIVAYLETLR